MCSNSEKNMSAYADQNHAPSLTYVRLECAHSRFLKIGHSLNRFQKKDSSISVIVLIAVLRRCTDCFRPAIMVPQLKSYF